MYYVNRSNRLNWGGIVSHIPYQIAEVSNYIDTVEVNGQPTEVLGEQIIRKRRFAERASLLGEYPLSINRRLEFTLGFERLSFDYEAEQAVYVAGAWRDLGKTDIRAPSALNFVQPAVGYVGDYSFFGFTSPVSGKRFRFEVEPTFGSLQYMNVLADYRHYFRLRPLTVAFRGLHYGRYLGDSESARLSQLFLGLQSLVRGYNSGSFTVGECTVGVGEEGGCPVFERLVGSKIGIFNAEIRLPLFGTSQYGLVDFSYLPTEVVAFYDAGVAWTDDDPPEFSLKQQSTERIPVTSAGIAGRFNLFGYVVAQLYWAFPFQRPEKTSQVGFFIAPGW